MILPSSQVQRSSLSWERTWQSTWKRRNWRRSSKNTLRYKLRHASWVHGPPNGRFEISESILRHPITTSLSQAVTQVYHDLIGAWSSQSQSTQCICAHKCTLWLRQIDIGLCVHPLRSHILICILTLNPLTSCHPRFWKGNEGQVFQ